MPIWCYFFFLRRAAPNQRVMAMWWIIRFNRCLLLTGCWLWKSAIEPMTAYDLPPLCDREATSWRGVQKGTQMDGHGDCFRQILSFERDN